MPSKNFTDDIAELLTEENDSENDVWSDDGGSKDKSKEIIPS